MLASRHFFFSWNTCNAQPHHCRN